MPLICEMCRFNMSPVGKTVCKTCREKVSQATAQRLDKIRAAGIRRIRIKPRSERRILRAVNDSPVKPRKPLEVSYIDTTGIRITLGYDSPWDAEVAYDVLVERGVRGLRYSSYENGKHSIIMENDGVTRH